MPRSRKTDLPVKHTWAFARRFRRHGFGWRTQPAVKAVREAVAEIRKVARTDPVLAGEGAVLFLEKVSAAIANVDGSSGGMGTAVNNAAEDLAAVIASAPAENTIREKWLDRLWQAIQDDQIPYLETLCEFWDRLCAKTEIGSAWAERLAKLVAFDSGHSTAPPGYYSAIEMYFGGLLCAGRTEEILETLNRGPESARSSRQWGVKALAAQGKVDEALAYARERHDGYTRRYDVTALCEKILIDAGRIEEAYQTFGLRVRFGTSYLNSFRAIVKKYPQKDPAAILKDLIERSKGEEGAWFATAKSLGFLDLALELANLSPCDPITLSKAARDFAAENPAFALEAGMASLRWLLAGNYYEITGIDVHTAVTHTLAAAKSLGKEEEAIRRIQALLESPQAVETIAKGLIKSALSLRASGKQIPEKLIERARNSPAGRWRSSQYNREKWQALEGDEEPG